MKIPQKPPLIETLLRNYDLAQVVRRATEHRLHREHEPYLHWEQLRHKRLPVEYKSHEEWWLTINMARLYLSSPLSDEHGVPFRFLLAPPIPELLHRIDLTLRGTIGIPEEVANPATRDFYYKRSLIEEALTSSQIEGAVATREAARDMVRDQRRPRTEGELMVLNNYRTMELVRDDLRTRPLSLEMIFEIQRTLCEGTLSNNEMGRFRTVDEAVRVEASDGAILHIPPPANLLRDRINKLCNFANGDLHNGFIHPVLAASMLHFLFAYEHPFVDGNGRTARALFYWSMLRNGYWLAEYISISSVIKKMSAGYRNAFLYTETDQNDMTYFLIYHLKIIERALEELSRYIAEKSNDTRQLEAHLPRLFEVLNIRQREVVGHALKHPGSRYTIAAHMNDHRVVYQTARSDLLGLEKHGLFRSVKAGRKLEFLQAENLLTLMQDLSKSKRIP